MVMKFIVYELWKDKWLFVDPQGNIEKIRRTLMYLRFCGTRSRDNKGGWVPELFTTLPTYQNPINMNPGQLLCKVSWFFGFLVVCLFFQFFGLLDPYWTPMVQLSNELLAWETQRWGILWSWTVKSAPKRLWCTSASLYRRAFPNPRRVTTRRDRTNLKNITIKKTYIKLVWN